MPKIDLCFSGWMRGVELTKATDNDGKIIDVSQMDAKQLTKDLQEGNLFVSLADLLANVDCDDDNIEIFVEK